MPTLETGSGKTVPLDEDAVNRAFDQSMNDGGPDTSAPPKRDPDEKRADEKPKTRRPRAPRQPKAEQARTTAAPKVTLTDDQRTEGVKGLAQIAATMCLMGAKATGSIALSADAVTIAGASDDIAAAVVQTAQADARFAAVLDKVCSAGPYAALVSVAFGVGSQIARNHRPALQLPGTVDPMELLTDPTQAAPAA